MRMNLVCCLLAVGLFGPLAGAQWNIDQKFPQIPQTMPRPPTNPQRPQAPVQHPPQLPRPQKPHQPPVSQQPQSPTKPQTPQQNQRPQNPQQNIQRPPKNQHPSNPFPQGPGTPQAPSVTQVTENFHTCEVQENLKIQCGKPGITGSECGNLNCCFDGQTCYYGKYVTLQCTKDGQFIVVVSRDATLPNIDLETISFLQSDTACNPAGFTSAFVVYQFPVTACGTQMSTETDVIVYENTITSSYEVLQGPAGSITRDAYFSLKVQCRYTSVSVEAVVIEVGEIPPPLPVAVIGPLEVELRLANGQCLMKGCVEEDVVYSSFYTQGDYPVRKVLRDPVYVDIRLVERSDPKIALTLGRCWATADPYAHSFPQWDLLIDGCPYQDDRYLTKVIRVDSSSGLEFPTHHKRFVFKMFTFVSMGTSPSNPTKMAPADAQGVTPLNEHIYIHCETCVCQLSSSNNCEPRCFRKRREIAGSLKKTYRHETTVASSGLIVISGEEAA